MIKVRAYNLIVSVIKELKEIEVLYLNLKSDISTGMSSSQQKIEIKKILKRLNKINFQGLNTSIELLNNNSMYEKSVKSISELLKKVEEMKKDLFSMDKEEIEEPAEDKKIQFIKDKFKFLEKEIGEDANTDLVIKDARQVESLISKLNFEDLPEGDYDEILEIKNSVDQTIKTYIGMQKAEKYEPYILPLLTELVKSVILHGENEKKAKPIAETILDFIEAPHRIELFEPVMKRIIAKKMTPKEFLKFYSSVKTMMNTKNDTFESYNSYKDKFIL